MLIIVIEIALILKKQTGKCPMAGKIYIRPKNKLITIEGGGVKSAVSELKKQPAKLDLKPLSFQGYQMIEQKNLEEQQKNQLSQSQSSNQHIENDIQNSLQTGKDILSAPVDFFGLLNKIRQLEKEPQESNNLQNENKVVQEAKKNSRKKSEGKPRQPKKNKVQKKPKQKQKQDDQQSPFLKLNRPRIEQKIKELEQKYDNSQAEGLKPAVVKFRPSRNPQKIFEHTQAFHKHTQKITQQGLKSIPSKSAQKTQNQIPKRQKIQEKIQLKIKEYQRKNRGQKLLEKSQIDNEIFQIYKQVSSRKHNAEQDEKQIQQQRSNTGEQKNDQKERIEKSCVNNKQIRGKKQKIDPRKLSLCNLLESYKTKLKTFELSKSFYTNLFGNQVGFATNFLKNNGEVDIQEFKRYIVTPFDHRAFSIILTHRLPKQFVINQSQPFTQEGNKSQMLQAFYEYLYSKPEIDYFLDYLRRELKHKRKAVRSIRLRMHDVIKQKGLLKDRPEYRKEVQSLISKLDVELNNEQVLNDILTQNQPTQHRPQPMSQGEAKNLDYDAHVGRRKISAPEVIPEVQPIKRVVVINQREDISSDHSIQNGESLEELSSSNSGMSGEQGDSSHESSSSHHRRQNGYDKDQSSGSSDFISGSDSLSSLSRREPSINSSEQLSLGSGLENNQPAHQSGSEQSGNKHQRKTKESRQRLNSDEDSLRLSMD